MPLSPIQPEPTQMNIVELQGFFDRYRSEVARFGSSVQAESFIEEFTRLSEAYIQLKSKTLQRQLSEAPQYNIFTILGLTRSEVRTHSAFLCHLLSPSASHGQGVLFLKSFLERCAVKDPDRFPKLLSFDHPDDWLVSGEHTSAFGRVDILIQNPKEGFLCVIENKVDAAEGIDQIKRYGHWLVTHERTYPYRVLCFLTIRGDSSLTSDDVPYIRLSYHQDIAEWLEDSLPHIQAPGVRAVVHQYQAIAISL